MDRDCFIWELMAGDPLFRQALCDIETISDTDRMVGELLALFRGVDEVLDDLRALTSGAAFSSKSLLKTGS